MLETYLQLIQKLDKTPKELYIRKPKHMLTYSMLYNVEPCNDIEEFKKRVNIAIQKESQKKEMSEVGFTRQPIHLYLKNGTMKIIKD